MQERVLVTGKPEITPDWEWLCARIDQAWFLDRDLAEENTRVVQIIPYVVLRCGDRYCTYTRGAKGTETRLHNLLSVGLGGHINPTDGDPGLGCLRKAMYRELQEEVSVYTRMSPEQSKGVIWDPSTPVGAVHLGVVMMFRLAKEAVLPKESGKIDGLEFLTRGQLIERLDQLEPWSRAVVENLL